MIKELIALYRSWLEYQAEKAAKEKADNDQARVDAVEKSKAANSIEEAMNAQKNIVDHKP